MFGFPPIGPKLSFSNGIVSYRKLKALTTKTPNEIIKEIRMKQVERLLATTNLSIDEIIYKTGFSNRGHFFKMFAQEYGMTPPNYRKQSVEAIKR